MTQYQFVDDFSKLAGRHSLKFGVNFRRIDLTDYYTGADTTPDSPDQFDRFFQWFSDVLHQSVPQHLSFP